MSIELKKLIAILMILSLAVLLGCEGLSQEQVKADKDDRAIDIRFRTECSGESLTEFEGGRTQAVDGSAKNQSIEVKAKVP